MSYKKHDIGFYQRNRDSVKRYVEKNRAMVTIKSRKYKRAYRQRIRNKLFDILGRVCVNCGFSDIRALQFDHINGDGYKQHTTTLKNRFILYHINNPEIAKTTLQVLCANCNWIKKNENNENTFHRLKYK